MKLESSMGSFVGNISYKLLGYDLPSSINIQKIMKESVHDGSYSTAIHLIAKSCQAFHIRKLEMIKFQVDISI